MNEKEDVDAHQDAAGRRHPCSAREMEIGAGEGAQTRRERFFFFTRDGSLFLFFTHAEVTP